MISRRDSTDRLAFSVLLRLDALGAAAGLRDTGCARCSA